MNQAWPIVGLGEVCAAKSGNSSVIKGKLWTESDENLFPAFSATGQDVFSDSYEHEGEAIIISAVGARCGKCFLASGKWTAIANTHILFPKKSKIDARFLWYLVNDESFWIKGGTAQPFVKVLDSLRRPIPLPPLPEQERIVRLLDAAEELRRLRTAADRRTADLIPALFNEMFGDPATNPKGWPTASLGDLIVDGPQNGLYKHSSAYGVGTPILRIDGFYDGFIDDLTSLKRLRLTSEEVEKYRLRPNDVVINRVNSPNYLGKSALISSTNEPTVFESNMMRFGVDREQFDPLFLIFHLQTPAIKQQIAKKAKHAIHQSSINQEDVKSLLVLRPPLSFQRQFAARVAEIRALETQQAASRRRLDDLFQSMLHRAFRGEL